MHPTWSKAWCSGQHELPPGIQYHIPKTNVVIQSRCYRGAHEEHLAGCELTTSLGTQTPAKRSHKYPLP